MIKLYNIVEITINETGISAINKDGAKINISSEELAKIIKND